MVDFGATGPFCYPLHPWVAPKRPILNSVKITDASWDSDRFRRNMENKMSIYDLNKTADSVEYDLFECKNVYLKLTCNMWLMISIKYGFTGFFPFYYGFICSPLKPNCYFCLASFITINMEIKNTSVITLTLA